MDDDSSVMVSDEWMALLEGTLPELRLEVHKANPAVKLSTGQSRSRSRSKGVCPPLFDVSVPVAQTCQLLGAEATAMAEGSVADPWDLAFWCEEDEKQLRSLNVIETNPADVEEFERKKSHQAVLDQLVKTQAPASNMSNLAASTPGGPVVQWSSSGAVAAARRVCADQFGSSSSVFQHGAMMSYFLRGTAYHHDLISSLCQTLPGHLRGMAQAQLQELTQTPGVELMPASHRVISEVESNVARALAVNPAVQFYVGISERPRVRLAEHKSNGFTKFWLYVYPSCKQSGRIETALIQILKHHEQCLNVGPGNEHASAGQPHYLYVAWKPTNTSSTVRCRSSSSSAVQSS